jgi:hypothetical protein
MSTALEDEAHWPRDFKNWTYVFRALREVLADGVDDEITKRRIEGVAAIWSSPRGRNVGPVKPSEWEQIWRDGFVRRPGLSDEPRNHDAVRNGGARCNVFVDRNALMGDPASEAKAAPTKEKPARAKRKAGAKAKFYWGPLEAEALRLMQEHGPFSDDDPVWNAQARLEDALLKFCTSKGWPEPSLTQLRVKLREWLI